MSFEAFLEERKRSAIAVFHRFRLEASTKPTTIFVEGFDDLILYKKIARDGRRELANFRITYGKRNMDRMLQWFYSEGYEQSDTLFIRDSDFDVYRGHAPSGSHLFLTCGYSVENYVVSLESLRRFYLEVFCVSPAEIDVEAEVQKFADASQLLLGWLSPVVGAILIAKTDGRDLNFDHLKTGPRFKAALKLEELKELERDELAAIGLKATDFTPASLAVGERYCSQDAMFWMRGHQAIAHASIFLEISYSALQAKLRRKEINQFHRKASADFSPHGLFERLAALTDGTKRLRQSIGS